LKEIIIDECIYSLELMDRLKKEGINAKYLGYGKQDIDIERYMIRNPTAVLVTADTEFDTHFGWDKSLLIESNDSLNDKVVLIKSFANG
jgi:hypothetical protein